SRRYVLPGTTMPWRWRNTARRWPSRCPAPRKGTCACGSRPTGATPGGNSYTYLLPKRSPQSAAGRPCGCQVGSGVEKGTAMKELVQRALDTAIAQGASYADVRFVRQEAQHVMVK